jgi:hypothetical protein
VATLTVMTTARLPDGRQVRALRHAVARYHERVRPSLFNYKRAARELRLLLEQQGRVVTDEARPEWLNDDDERSGIVARATEWVMLGDDIAFPLMEGYLVTCLARGHVSDKALMVRREKRAARGRVRRDIRRSGGKVSERRYIPSGRPLREWLSDDGEWVT